MCFEFIICSSFPKLLLFRGMNELLELFDRLKLYRIFQDEKCLQMTDVLLKRKGIDINLHNCLEKRDMGWKDAGGEGEGVGKEERGERLKLRVPMRR